jgi:hypothetical protein
MSVLLAHFASSRCACASVQASGEKVLVFSFFKRFLDLVAEALVHRNIATNRIVRLHGSMPAHGESSVVCPSPRLLCRVYFSAHNALELLENLVADKVTLAQLVTLKCSAFAPSPQQISS